MFLNSIKKLLGAKLTKITFMGPRDVIAYNESQYNYNRYGAIFSTQEWRYPVLTKLFLKGSGTKSYRHINLLIHMEVKKYSFDGFFAKLFDEFTEVEYHYRLSLLEPGYMQVKEVMNKSVIVKKEKCKMSDIVDEILKLTKSVHP